MRSAKFINIINQSATLTIIIIYNSLMTSTAAACFHIIEPRD